MATTLVRTLSHRAPEIIRRGLERTMEIVYRDSGQFLEGRWTHVMIEGSRYRLRTSMLSVDPEMEATVLIPGGELIQIDKIRDAHKRMVDVLWNGQTLSLFMVDIEDRCDEVTER